MTQQYQGEQLLWGEIGHMLVVIAFISALFSVIVNYLRVKQDNGEIKWKSTARFFYTTHAVSAFGILLTLLLMIVKHRYEYQYVWQHSKSDMKMNYVLACIWEGQEGSTLLWLVWHGVIGLILMKRAKQWEAPVLTVVALVQVFLSMMLLGIYVGGVHVGSNPFGLMRLQEDNIGLPWTKMPDYLAHISDGHGLNPLLQNYWMTIHPPTLFCGFALTTIPFAFAIAGLWTKKYHDWQSAALPWAFTGVMVLGTGILMGGAWAYESLSFGGFWAWDPVENASLVPWLVLVGAAHVMLLYKQKGQSLFTTFLLCIFAFLLIVYSTFLTKSGILAKTSVHAFTDDGLNEELTAFMGFFLWLSVMLLSFNTRLKIIYTAIAVLVLIMFFNGMHGASMLLLLVSSFISLILGYWKFFPKTDKEEELWSREFWMFIGSLVLLVAAFQIIFYTSSPVVNKFLEVSPVHHFMQSMYHQTGWQWIGKMADANIAPDKDVVNFFNKWQISFAVIICLLVGFTQYLKYRNTDFKTFIREIRIPLIASIVLSVIISFTIYYNSQWNSVTQKKQYIFMLCSILLFSCIFTILANANYWRKVFGGKISKAGASIAHVGFGVLILGVVISTSKKDTISRNTSKMDLTGFAEDIDNLENIYMLKGDTLPMGPYLVTYTNHQRKIKNGTGYVYFNVDFIEKGDNGKPEKVFTLSPFYQLNPIMGNAREPDTKHYIFRDIYSSVKFAEDRLLDDSAEKADLNSDHYDEPLEHNLTFRDTLGLENCILVLDSANEDSLSPLNQTNEKNLVAYFSIFNSKMERHIIESRIFFDKKTSVFKRILDGEDESTGVKVSFADVDNETKKLKIYTSIRLNHKPDYMVLQVSVFPGINILWIGCLIMITGTFIAVRERVRKKNRDDKKAA
ncbi:MAG: cytochrome c biogenesis protein CcsA [Bacteroidetes bacterium]|nr:cytochrome c biogenesis protein CcsA [Bacteroidota bacterium]